MMIALVAMFAMTMSANAQSDDREVTFKRLSCYLELTEGQMDQVRTSMAIYDSGMEHLFQPENRPMGHRRGRFFREFNEIQNQHKKQMKLILNEKQYDKFEQLFNLTIENNFIIGMANRARL